MKVPNISATTVGPLLEDPDDLLVIEPGQLKRIADALERIADASERPKPFTGQGTEHPHFPEGTHSQEAIKFQEDNS